MKKEKSLPAKSLSVKLKGSEEFQSITGLFQKTSEKGNVYFYGTPKGEADTFYLFIGKNKKGEEEITLNVKEGKARDAKLIKLAVLKKNDKGTLFGPNLNNADEMFFVTNVKPK